VRLHQRLAQPVAVRLRQLLTSAGIEIVNRAGAPLCLSIDAISGPDPSAPLVALYDGHLDPAYADWVASSPPVMFLACREQTGTPSEWEVRMLAQLLRKTPLFKLLPGEVIAWDVRQLTDLSRVSGESEAACRKAGARASVATMVAEVMHELVANALLAAPVDASGSPKYALRRSEQPIIATEDVCIAALSMHEGRAFLAARDRHGTLSTGPVARAIRAMGGKAAMNTSGGGAGLGLIRVLQQCDAFGARVVRGVSSEVVCALDMGEARRRTSRPKSVFFVEGVPGV
jgi:hypothetical protein